MFYSLTRPELMDLLASAETLLAATGNAAALCPNYGTRARMNATSKATGSNRSATTAAARTNPIPTTRARTTSPNGRGK